MKKRIFRSIFAVVMLASAVTLLAAYIFALLSIPNFSAAVKDYASAIILFVLLFIVSDVLLALLVAWLASSGIVKPITDIDPRTLSDQVVYEELAPIVSRLSVQNTKVSKQKNELTMRENEFNSITHYMSEGMLVINARAEILTANRSAKDIFGVKNGQKSILVLDSSDGFREAIGSALSGKNGYYSFRRGDKYYSLIATPVSRGKILEGAVIVVFDVTEKEEREALRREFTSNISHELKTPLTSISGFAELIGSGMAEGEDAKRFAGNIHKEASRLITLVGDIIRLSQLDGGEIPYDEEPIDLLAVGEEVSERLSAVAEKAGITVSVSGEQVSVPGNYTAIEEIIYNLTDNAIKYNRPGGFVKISVSLSGSEGCVSVSDNGIGIPKDKQDRVFERFYRVDKSHSRAIGGTGLGLSIVKHAVAYHKAKLKLKSEEGVGTEITVSFEGAVV